MTTKTASDLRAAAKFHGLIVLHGWHLIGAGPARFGWATLTGQRLGWLGATAGDAFETLLELI